MFLVPEQATAPIQIAMINENVNKRGFIGYLLLVPCINTNEPKKWVFLAHLLCDMSIRDKSRPLHLKGSSRNRRKCYEGSDSIVPILFRNLRKNFGICNWIIEEINLFSNMIRPK